MTRKIKLFLPALTWFLLSFYLLTLPGSAVPVLNWFNKIQGDKLVHIAIFAIMVILLLFPVQRLSGSPIHFKTILFIALAALAYGVVMEFVQENYIPNRSFDVFDMIADGIGCFLGIGCWKYLSAKRTSTS
ncbi:MAG: VanZ family protein [Bacteroidota bacterium]